MHHWDQRPRSQLLFNRLWQRRDLIQEHREDLFLIGLTGLLEMRHRFVAVSPSYFLFFFFFKYRTCFVHSLFSFFFFHSRYGEWINRRIEIPFTVIAIFFAVRLNKAKLPEWVDWILAAYVVFHILTHLILTVRMIFDISKAKFLYIYLISYVCTYSDNVFYLQRVSQFNS